MKKFLRMFFMVIVAGALASMVNRVDSPMVIFNVMADMLMRLGMMTMGQIIPEAVVYYATVTLTVVSITIEAILIVYVAKRFNLLFIIRRIINRHP